MSLTVGGFYGARNKRKWLGIERSVDQAVKRHKEDKIPTAFKSRILGPSTKWETFYRQQDAFSCARSTAKDLHVFAFESESLAGDTGQRMYLVASYPAFWHYYSQLSGDKRHHYEIIPEGAVCKLYFDLEFDVAANPDRNGSTMVETLIKYVCLCLKKQFKVQVGRENILDVDASTDKKFSRHLIFLLKNAAFKNNIHAGKFVCYVMSKLREYVKTETDNSDVKNNLNSQNGDKQPAGSAEHISCQRPSEMNGLETFYNNKNQHPISSSSGMDDAITDYKDSVESRNVCGDSELNGLNSDMQAADDTIKLLESSRSLYSRLSKGSDEKNTCKLRDCETNSNDVVENNTENTVADGKVGSNNKTLKEENHRNREPALDLGAILSEFSIKDLLSMIVKNKHGEDTLFCDTGVYTKNRNFRLIMSSKMGKKNPLVVSDQNQYKPDKGKTSAEQIFYDSLVANVQYDEKMRILCFDNDSPEGLKIGRSQRSSQDRNAGSTIEGYCKSPYPEVDDFISDLITQHGGHGVIRHWTYFQQGELLVYEISRYRFCHNIGREHRSNNIMYIADLRRGVFYQKCHDPDCQAQSFKSQDWPLPREVLPAHYFDELPDDMDFEEEDDEFLNTTAEMERQYFLNQSKESGAEDLSLILEDGDDDDLMSAVDQIEAKHDR